MKLHRLVMANYRGITYREVDFPESGVVVVCGANEVGKSSMIEALDLLLDSKDRSTKKDVKQVKPTHADAGSEVIAEISTGPYRFRYRKRFHKKPETELTVLAPRREQLTGDEAHDRVRAMLAETVDAELWHAQRVLQAASTAEVEFSGCDALARALDAAAGDTAAPSGSEPLLIERIEGEYARYFTPTGRPTGEWAAATAALHEAEDEMAQCAAAVAEVDDRVRRHAALTTELVGLAEQQQPAEARHRAAHAAADRVAELTEQLREAKLVAAAATATSDRSAAAQTERARLRTEVDARTTTVAGLQAEAGKAAGVETTARAAAEAAAKTLAAAERRAESAQIAARLAKIDSVQQERVQVCGELAAIVLTEQMMQRIERAAVGVERMRSRLESLSATVEFTATADIELTIDNRRVVLPAGQSWSTAVSAATDVEIPGVLTARFSPGATALDITAELTAAQQELTAALNAGQVADVPAARATDQRRRELSCRRDQLAAQLAGLCGDDRVDQLRARLAELRWPVGAVSMDSAAASTERDQAAAASRRAAAALAEATTQAVLLREKAATLQAELSSTAHRLAEQRASCSDEDLAARANAEQLQARTADQRVAALIEQLSAAAPETVAAELAEAARVSAALTARHEQIARELREIAVELTVFGTEGRRGKLDAAEIRHEHARNEYTRVQRRARAVELLRSVMSRHRDNIRLRYVEPFRAELERLGRPVFGPSFQVEVDSHLRIVNRTVDGCTVPYDSLSGGAKEQLGILTRLAGAALVAKEDTVPVLIDDALGFTDPDRLAKMGAVFDTVGAEGQVIVLTCTPGRYDGVKGAHRIELTA
jgi:hypothetical protein